MTDKRFWLVSLEYNGEQRFVRDNNLIGEKSMSNQEFFDFLNILSEENEKLKKGMIRVVDRYIKNVECNPLSYAQPYRKVKRTLNNIREDLRSLIGDVE